MLKLSISGKAATGACTNQLTINGPTARDPPVLCGTITGQHSKLVLNGKHQKHSKPAFLTFLDDQGVYGTFGLKIPNKNFATCRTGEILSHGQKIREIYAISNFCPEQLQCQNLHYGDLGHENSIVG